MKETKDARFRLLSFKSPSEFLRAWDNGAHVSKPDNKECDRLEEYVYEVVVLSIHKIIASGKKEENRKTKLRKMNSTSPKKHKLNIHRLKCLTSILLNTA